MSPLTIKLQPFGRCEPAHGHRVWDVEITVTKAGRPSESSSETKRLEDYFSKHKYEAYERYVVDLEGELKRKERASGTPSVIPDLTATERAGSTASEYPPESWPPSLISQSTGLTAASDQSVVEYSPNTSISASLDSRSLEDELCNYRAYLEDWLDLRRWADEEEIKIYICETLTSTDLDDPSYPSIHSLLWECLESRCSPEEHARKRQGQQPLQAVHITRVIIHNASPSQLPQGLRVRDGTIRLLVVVARHFGKRHHKYWSQSMFDDPPSVVQDTLIDLVQYLRSIGRHRRLQVDVLRPGTLGELDTHLASHPHYDMVHLDLHGDVLNGPILCFAKSFSKDQRHHGGRTAERLGYHYTPVDASEVARVLKQHGITVIVLSACLSSWAHSRPLSNMCHVFANHGVKAITGMSYSVLYNAAHTYFEEFYRHLVLENLSFRDSSLRARDKLQGGNTAGNAISQCWPIVTTYYTTRSLERADTGLLGIGMEPYNPEAVETFGPFTTSRRLIRWIGCLIVGLTTLRVLLGLGFPEIHSAIIAAGATFVLKLFIEPAILRILRIDFTGKEKNCISSLTKFEEFREYNRELRPPMRHSVGLMALEDRLKAQGKLLLVVEPTLCGRGKKRRIHYIRDVWLTTNFASEVQDFDAGSFCRTFYRARRAVSDWGPKTDGDKEARSGVLIFYNMEKVLRNSSALEAINLLIAQKERLWSKGCYLLMISSKPWTGENLQPTKRKWVLAESFNAIEHFNIFFPYETDNDPP